MARIIVVADHVIDHHQKLVTMDTTNIQDTDLDDLETAIELLEELADAVQHANVITRLAAPRRLVPVG